MMWGWEPQRPKGWTPNSLCIGIPNGQSNGSQSWGALWFRRARPQNHIGLGSPMAKAMGTHLGVLCGPEGPDPKLMCGWDPHRPKGWSPNSRGVGVPNGQSNGSPTWGALWFLRVDPKLMWGWDPQWPKQWEANLGCSVVPKGRAPKSCGVGNPKDQRGGPQILCALGSPMAKAMGPQLGVSRGPSWPDPKLGVCWDPH